MFDWPRRNSWPWINCDVCLLLRKQLSLSTMLQLPYTQHLDFCLFVCLFVCLFLWLHQEEAMYVKREQKPITQFLCVQGLH